MFEKHKGFDEAIQAAIKGMESEDWNIREAALNLCKACSIRVVIS